MGKAGVTGTKVSSEPAGVEKRHIEKVSYMGYVIRAQR